MGESMKKAQALRYVSQEVLRNQVSNTYEGVMIAARAARLINLQLKMLGTQNERDEKVTTTALNRLLEAKLRYAVNPARRASEESA
jgi:DNA-directed RNA polymerase omega subunit